MNMRIKQIIAREALEPSLEFETPVGEEGGRQNDENVSDAL